MEKYQRHMKVKGLI